MTRFQLLLLLTITIHTITIGQTIDNDSLKNIEWKSLDDENYHIEYPGTWLVNTTMPMGIKFAILSPLSDTTDNFRENVNLLTEDLTGKYLTLDQYIELSEKQIQILVTDYKKHLSERNKNNTLEYHKLIYSSKQGIFDLIFEQFIWLKSEKAYILTLTCKLNEFEICKKTGEKILQSFKLK